MLIITPAGESGEAWVEPFSLLWLIFRPKIGIDAVLAAACGANTMSESTPDLA